MRFFAQCEEPPLLCMDTSNGGLFAIKDKSYIFVKERKPKNSPIIFATKLPKQ